MLTVEEAIQSRLAEQAAAKAQEECAQREEQGRNARLARRIACMMMQYVRREYGIQTDLARWEVAPATPQRCFSPASSTITWCRAKAARVSRMYCSCGNCMTAAKSTP